MTYTTEATKSIALIPVSKSELEDFLKKQTETIINWVKSVEFTASVNESCIVPDANGSISMVLIGVEEQITKKAGTSVGD